MRVSLSFTSAAVKSVFPTNKTSLYIPVEQKRSRPRYSNPSLSLVSKAEVTQWKCNKNNCHIPMTTRWDFSKTIRGVNYSLSIISFRVDGVRDNRLIILQCSEIVLTHSITQCYKSLRQKILLEYRTRRRFERHFLDIKRTVAILKHVGRRRQFVSGVSSDIHTCAGRLMRFAGD